MTFIWLIAVGCSEWGSQSGPAVLDDDNQQQVETVKIGAILPMSWPASAYWSDSVNWIQDAVDEFNRENQGDISIDLIVEDGKCTPSAAVSAVEKLTSVDKIDVLIGGLCSWEAIAAWKIAQEKQIPILSPTASSPEVSTIGDYMFRFVNDAHAISSTSDQINELFTGSVALIVEGTDFAQALGNTFKDIYNGEIVEEVSFNSSEKDFSIIAQSVAQSSDEFDWIVLITQTPDTTIPLMQAFDRVWLVDQFRWDILWFYSFSDDKAQEEISDLVEWNYELQAGWLELMGTKAREYFSEYVEKYGNPQALDSFILLSRESIHLILDAVRAWNYTSESIRNYFVSVTEDNPRDWYFGEYYFDEYWDAVGFNFVVQQQVDWDWEVVE